LITNSLLRGARIENRHPLRVNAYAHHVALLQYEFW